MNNNGSLLLVRGLAALAGLILVGGVIGFRINSAADDRMDIETSIATEGRVSVRAGGILLQKIPVEGTGVGSSLVSENLARLPMSVEPN